MRLARDVGHREILVDEPLARVDEHEGHVGALGGRERAQLRVVLDPLALLALAAEAGGVDEHERRGRRAASTVSIASRVVPGTSETITRSSPSSAFRRLDLPTFGRPRIATRIASSPTSCRPLPGSIVDDRVEQVAGAVAVQGRERASGRRGRAGGTRARARPAPGRRSCSRAGAPACAPRRRIAASSSSPGVIPARASTTNRTRSASAIAARACSAIERVIGVGSAMSTPPVSISRKRCPFQSRRAPCGRA